MHITQYEALTDHQVKSEYIRALERAEDFFVHKFSFEKVWMQILYYLIVYFQKISICPQQKGIF